MKISIYNNNIQQGIYTKRQTVKEMSSCLKNVCSEDHVIKRTISILVITKTVKKYYTCENSSTCNL